MSILSLGIGSAGTGENLSGSVPSGDSSQASGQVKRIILASSSRGFGESLGFLPGDLKEKVDPYLRIGFMILVSDFGQRPDDALWRKYWNCSFGLYAGGELWMLFVILDEAQKYDIMQMKIFLTRLGFNLRWLLMEY